MKYAKFSGALLVAVAVLTFCLASPSAAQAQDRHVKVINETSHSMIHFYASNVSRPGWEEDILGRAVLLPDYWVNVNIDDGTGYCHFDLKAVFSDGSDAIRYNVNVCQVETWTIYD
jgi:hypothetical protein